MKFFFIVMLFCIDVCVFCFVFVFLLKFFVCLCVLDPPDVSPEMKPKTFETFTFHFKF